MFRKVDSPVAAFFIVICTTFPRLVYGEDPFFIPLPFLPNSFEVGKASAVSTDGQFIAGCDATTENVYCELVRWTDPGPGGAVAEGLGAPDWAPNGMFAVAICDDGMVIAGWGQDILASTQMATRWSDPDAGGSGFTALGVLPGPHPIDNSFSTDMTSDGAVIVGLSISVDLNLGLEFDQPFRWELTDPGTGDGEMVALPVLDGHEQGRAQRVSSDGTIIVGSSWLVFGEFTAVRWENGDVTSLAALERGGSSQAAGISPDGSYIVGSASLDGVDVPVRWSTDGDIEQLAAPPSGFAPHAVANSGLAIGSGFFGAEGTVWTVDGEAHAISDWLMTEFGIDTSDWLLQIPADLSADGEFIVGTGDLGVPVEAPWLAFVAEPCTWDLDGDDNVGTGDLILLLGSWGDPYGTADLIELLGNWGPCPK